MEIARDLESIKGRAACSWARDQARAQFKRKNSFLFFSEKPASFGSALRLGHRNSLRPPKAYDHPERAFNRL